jgi:hypothetical protein
MEGIVLSYTGSTLIIDVDDTGGSGTKTSWKINLGGSVKGHNTTSISSVTIATATATFLVGYNMGFTVGNIIRAASSSDATKYIEGDFVSYTGNTLVISQRITSGTGSYSSWNIGLGGNAIKTKILDIGDWNMDTTDQVTVATGIANYKNIRSVSVIIRNDGDNSYSLLNAMDGFYNPLGAVRSIGASILLIRNSIATGYDNTSYDQTAYNRGWITIEYID